MTWIETIPVAEIGEEGVTSARAGTLWVALYRVGDDVFATSVICTHGQSSLADGYLDGYEIECPLHQGAFDIRTGAPTASPCTVPIRTFPVAVRDGMIFVEVADGEA